MELKGELRLLYDELNSTDPEVKKDALKKTIVYMSVGRDVSPIFQTVIRCLEINDIEMKKLIYLYIINYSQSRPKDAIMVINQFCKDVNKQINTKPLIRALALRTMGCLRVKELNEFLIKPLLEGLQDQNSYVRKTAVLCVPKIYEISPDLAEKADMLSVLKGILDNDTNSMVQANAIQALVELSSLSKKKLIQVSSKNLDRILGCLNETFEWGQIFILDLLTDFEEATSAQAEIIIDRILPRLTHINPAIVFTALRTVIAFQHLLSGPIKDALAPKLTYPLKSLLNSYPEVSYALLKYLQSVVLVYPQVLGENYSDYICSYNDPLYIKLEKMEIMYRMTNEKNAKAIMNEFFEYHKELNSDFVKIAIEYIAKICLRVNIETPHGIELYTKVLEGLGEKTGGDYVDSITIACVKIMRVFPKVKGGTQIAKLISTRFKDLFSTEAKASFIWLLGEYCKRIDNAGPILEHFTKSYFSQPPEVQLRILNTGIKMYLFQIEPIDSVMSELIQSISDKSTNPDLRDRGYIYWRLLYKDDEKAKEIIFNEPQAVEVDVKFSKEQIDEAARQLRYGGRISGILGKSPEELFRGKELVNRGVVEVDSEVMVGHGEQPSQQTAAAPTHVKPEVVPAQKKPDLIQAAPEIGSPKDPSSSTKKAGFAAPPGQGNKKAADKEVDLLDLGGFDTTPTNATQASLSNQNTQPKPSVVPHKPKEIEENLFEEDDKEEDLFEGADETFEYKFVSMPEETLVRKETKGKAGTTGISIKGNFYRESHMKPLMLRLSIKNSTSAPIDGMTFQFKQNYFGLKTIKPNSGTIGIEEKAEVVIEIETNNSASINLKESLVYPYSIHTAFKCSSDTYFFKIPIHMNHLLELKGQLTKIDLKRSWNQTRNTKVYPPVSIPAVAKNSEALANQLRENNMFVVQKKREDDDLMYLYISCRAANQKLSFLCLELSSQEMGVEVRSEDSEILDLLYQGLLFALNQ